MGKQHEPHCELSGHLYAQQVPHWGVGVWWPMQGAAMGGFGNTVATMLGRCLHTPFAHAGFRRVLCSTRHCREQRRALWCPLCVMICGWFCRHITLTGRSRSFCCLPGIAFIPPGLPVGQHFQRGQGSRRCRRLDPSTT